MKTFFKILLGLLFVFAAVQVSAQPTGATKVNTSFTAPLFVYVGGGNGSTNDTLYASDTLTYSIRVSKNFTQNIGIRAYIDKVTGTVSDTIYFYGSYDGTTKDVAIDSIFNSNVSDGYKYVTASRWTSFRWPYLLIVNWDKGGARTGVKSVRRFDIISNNN